MTRNKVLTVSIIIMVILAIIMIVLGFMGGPKIMLPPIITGIGFLVVAWTFSTLREK